MDSLTTPCILLLTLASCLVPTVQPDGDTSGSTTADDTTSTSSSSSTEPANPSASDSLTSPPDPSDADSSGPTSDASTDTTEDGTGAAGAPEGTECEGDDECQSGHCYDVGALGGICSECEHDEDCAELGGFGCNPPDVAAPVVPAMCGDGQLGSGCESSAACARGLTCELVLSIPLVHDFMSCSSCATHEDCSGDRICSVTIDITTTSGFWSCLEPGSVEIGGTCDHDGDGDLVCASGNCAEAGIDNWALMGLCSECDENSDCDEGWHCQEADIDTFNVMSIPAVCVQD